jgi:uncharacterized phage-associated protein
MMERMYESATRPMSGDPRGRTFGDYPAGVVLSAHDVAEELRRRLPGLPTKKMHKLLYYCQGHHVATFGQPLFAERLEAWDMGPVVGALWRDENYGLEPPPRQALDEAALNTVGFVVSRYGRLNGYQLQILTHGEPPWRLANAHRQPRERVDMDPVTIADYFRTYGAPDDGTDDTPLDSGDVSEWLRHSTPPLPEQLVEFDDLDRLRTWASRGT